MSVRLADGSFQYPVGIAENMLVEVGKFTFLADFVILEMEEDKEDFDALLAKGSKILYSIKGTLLKEEIFSEFNEFIEMTEDENFESESDIEEPPFEKIIVNTDYKIKTSLEEPPTDLELKPLPDNLEYVFLEEPYFFPVIISSQLSAQNKSKLQNPSFHQRNRSRGRNLFEFDKFIAMVSNENYDSESDEEEPKFRKITINTDYKIKTSLEEPPTDLELKPLPDNLEYVFLEEPSFLLVIISSQLSAQNKSKLHKIQLLDDKKPVVQKQRRLNPNMQEVVKKEIMKLLDTGIIYSIANSPWVSPIHCVPKKGVPVLTSASFSAKSLKFLSSLEDIPRINTTKIEYLYAKEHNIQEKDKVQVQKCKFRSPFRWKELGGGVGYVEGVVGGGGWGGSRVFRCGDCDGIRGYCGDCEYCLKSDFPTCTTHTSFEHGKLCQLHCSENFSNAISSDQSFSKTQGSITTVLIPDAMIASLRRIARILKPLGLAVLSFDHKSFKSSASFGNPIS
ncbi:hypothetical protein Tco_0152940 [Tanacetum coccineum]